MRASSAGERRLAADSKHVGLTNQARTDHNNASCPNIPGRVHGSIQFHIDVVDLGWTEAASHRPGTDSELREPLNHAVGNMQRIAGLPVDSISHSLSADLHVLEPAYGRTLVEW